MVCRSITDPGWLRDRRHSRRGHVDRGHRERRISRIDSVPQHHGNVAVRHDQLLASLSRFSSDSVRGGMGRGEHANNLNVDGTRARSSLGAVPRGAERRWRGRQGAVHSAPEWGTEFAHATQIWPAVAEGRKALSCVSFASRRTTVPSRQRLQRPRETQANSG